MKKAEWKAIAKSQQSSKAELQNKYNGLKHAIRDLWVDVDDELRPALEGILLETPEQIENAIRWRNQMKTANRIIVETYMPAIKEQLNTSVIWPVHVRRNSDHGTA